MRKDITERVEKKLGKVPVSRTLKVNALIPPTGMQPYDEPEVDTQQLQKVLSVVRRPKKRSRLPIVLLMCLALSMLLSLVFILPR